MDYWKLLLDKINELMPVKTNQYSIRILLNTSFLQFEINKKEGNMILITPIGYSVYLNEWIEYPSLKIDIEKLIVPLDNMEITSLFKLIKFLLKFYLTWIDYYIEDLKKLDYI